MRLGPFVPTRTLSDFYCQAIRLASETDVTSRKKSHFPSLFHSSHLRRKEIQPRANSP